MDDAWIIVLIFVLLGLGQWRMYSVRKRILYEAEQWVKKNEESEDWAPDHEEKS